MHAGVLICVTLKFPIGQYNTYSMASWGDAVMWYVHKMSSILSVLKACGN